MTLREAELQKGKRSIDVASIAASFRAGTFCTGVTPARSSYAETLHNRTKAVIIFASRRFKASGLSEPPAAASSASHLVQPQTDSRSRLLCAEADEPPRSSK